MNSTALTPLRLFDNTRISDFKRCARYYYFRHIRFFVPEEKATALIFGGAWHEGMDVIWAHHKAPRKEWPEVVNLAYNAFVEKWVKEGLPHPDNITPDDEDQLAPRTPMNAKEMYYEYIPARQNMFTDPSFELLAIEEPFAAPLDPNNDALFYVGRLDKKFRYRGQVYCGEHKTTTMYRKNGPFRADFVDSFSPNSQIDGYLFALSAEFGAEKVGGVWVDAALVHRSEHDGFKFIPIDRQHAMLEGWLWTAHTWVDQIIANQEAILERQDAKAPYMAAFPQNTNSCVAYGRLCPYADICKTVSNPLRITDVPLGYKLEKWSPFDEIKLEKIGFTLENTGETRKILGTPG